MLGCSVSGMRGTGFEEDVTARAKVNRSPAERRDDVLHFRKIVEQEIGLMLRQLLAGPGAGRDGDRPRSEDSPAGDIMPGVADHIDGRGGEFVAMFLLRAPPGKGAQLIAIVVVVGKRAELEVIPKPVT